MKTAVRDERPPIHWGIFLALGAVLWVLAAGPAAAATVPVYWDPVTKNTDATAITDLNGYRVFCATYSLAGMTPAQALSAGAVLKSTAVAAATGLSVSGLANATTYYFRLTAFNNAGTQSDWSVQPDGLTDLELSLVTPAPPAAPVLNPLTVVFSSRIDVNWSAVPNATGGYRVERSTDGVAFATVTTTAQGLTAFSDAVAPSTRYYYQVFAKNDLGESAPSNVATDVTPAPPVNPPTPPTALSTSAVTSNEIDLAWQDNSTDESGFEVVWSLSPAFTSVSTITVSAQGGTGPVAYAHLALQPGTAYYYKVRAVNGVGDSALTPAVPLKVTTLAAPLTPPAAPLNAQAPLTSSTTVTLQWTDASNNETGFLLEAASDANFYYVQKTTTVPAGSQSFTFTGLASGTPYYFRVRAANGAGLSAGSAVTSARTTGVSVAGFGVPAGLKAAYAYPNPAVGVDPVILTFMGGVDLVEITIFDQAGRAVLSDRVTQSVNVNGEPAFAYTWSGVKASGVYYAVIHGKSGDKTVRARAKFAVVGGRP